MGHLKKKKKRKKGVSSDQQVKSTPQRNNKCQKGEASSEQHVKVNVPPRQQTQNKFSRRRSCLNDPSLLRDLISRAQFVGIENVCHANKLV